MAWPPILQDLRDDLSIPDGDTRDDDALAERLEAAVAFTEDVHGVGSAFLDSPRARLGTIMLARRWYSRRNTPDGLVQAGELGLYRIGSGDRDIDRLLRIGQFRKSVIS